MGCTKSKVTHHIIEGMDIPINEEPDGDSLAILPPRIREKIFRLLDQASKLVLREVCKTFKAEIDHGAGLQARINDYEQGNLKFIKSIEVTEGSILHISDDVFRAHKNPQTSAVLRCYQNLEKLEVWGKVSYLIFSGIILKSSETLTEMSFKPLAFITRYINPSPELEPMPATYVFPRLRKLEIHYGFMDSPTQDLKVFNENMRFLLKTIHCPRLRWLRLIPEPSLLRKLLSGHKELDHNNVRWENHSLKDFISEHRNSLRFLELGLYRTYNLFPVMGYKYPRYLHTYNVTAPCMEAVRPEHVRDYFQETLGVQVRLKALTLQVEWFNNFLRAFQFLKRRVFVNNFETLTELCIHSYHRKPSDEDVEMEHFVEFNIFSRLLNLRILILTVLQVHHSNCYDLFNGLYFNEIPKSIRELTVRGVLLASDDLLAVAKAEFIHHYTFIDCGTSGCNGVNFEVAKALFTSKKLRYIKIRGLNDDTDPRSLYALLLKFNGKISEVIEMEYPAKKIGWIDQLPCCCCLRASGEENLNL